jgi:hypothetical protein
VFSSSLQPSFITSPTCHPETGEKSGTFRPLGPFDKSQQFKCHLWQLKYKTQKNPLISEGKNTTTKPVRKKF